MDRRHRDYYAVTFDERVMRWKYYLTGDFRERFSIKSQLATYGKHIVKVRWYSINHQPYALISIPKRFANEVLGDLLEVPGVHKIVEWNARREKEFANQLGFIKHFTDRIRRSDAIGMLHLNARQRHSEFAERIVTGDVDITW